MGVVRATIGDSEIGIEVDEEPGVRDVGGPDVARKAREVMVASIDAVKSIASAFRESVNAMPDEVRPEELLIAFGVKISAELGVMIAKGSTDCHLQVTLSWKQA